MTADLHARRATLLAQLAALQVELDEANVAFDEADRERQQASERLAEYLDRFGPVDHGAPDRPAAWGAWERAREYAIKQEIHATDLQNQAAVLRRAIKHIDALLEAAAVEEELTLEPGQLVAIDVRHRLRRLVGRA